MAMKRARTGSRTMLELRRMMIHAVRRLTTISRTRPGRSAAAIAIMDTHWSASQASGSERGASAPGMRRSPVSRVRRLRLSSRRCSLGARRRAIRNAAATIATCMRVETTSTFSNSQVSRARRVD